MKKARFHTYKIIPAAIILLAAAAVAARLLMAPDVAQNRLYVPPDAGKPTLYGAGYLTTDPVTYILDAQNELIGNYPGLNTSSQLLFGITASGILGAGDQARAVDPYSVSLPSSYDGRAKGFVSAVANQQGTRLCWDFSTISSIETYMLLHNASSASTYSQANMAYALSNSVSTLGFARAVADGGNFEMAMAYATRWQGPVLYSADPFSPDIGKISRTEAQNDKPAALHVQGYQQIPYNYDDIKNAIMKYGSVVSSIYVDAREEANQTSPIYNKATSSHYDYTAHVPNHQIQIVGWINSYPASKFSTDPGMNGAWIVKSSWGTDFGDSGYFYISYNDVETCKNMYAVSDIEPVGNYDNIYLYDPFGQTAYVNYNDDTAWYANTFTPKKTGETLQAVAFYSENNDTSYQIYYGTSLGGKKALIAQGRVANVGYYTVPLAAPVQLSASPFTIFVKISTTSGIADIPLETNVPNYITTAVSSPGGCFISADGTDWADITKIIPKSNICVRAFTSNS